MSIPKRDMLVAAEGADLVLATATIASGGTTSGAVDLGGAMIAGIDMGAAFTGIALSIQNSVDGGTTFNPAYDSTGTAVSWTVAAGHYLKFDPPLLGYDIIKLVSGSTEGTARTLTLVLVP